MFRPNTDNNYKMSIFRDKFNSKSSTTSTKPVQQKITNFDETWLKINVVGGQTQLCPIKLSCTWAVANITQKPPELTCNWFNKTQNSMNLIDGVTGSYYQPSLADVGTIIHVQCMPSLEGAQYEGMPLIKEIGPVKIDPETQEQANELLVAKKAIFSLKMKTNEPIIVAAQSQALIKIQQSTFRVVQKTQEQQKILLSTDIYEDNLVLSGNRAKAKQLQIACPGEQKLIVELTNNKVRDVLLLLQKLITIKNKQKEESILQNQLSELSPPKQAPKQVKRQSEISDKNTNVTPSQENNASIRCESNSNEGNEEDQKKKEPEVEDLPKSKQSQTFSEQRLGSEEHIDKIKSKKGDIMEIKSTQDLTQTSSPKKKEMKTEQVLQVVSSPSPNSSKQNALQILQITDLKKQLRGHESQIHKLNKVIGEKNDRIEQLQQQIGRMKQRESSLSCNFFQLQDQVKRAKISSEKTSEEVSYYKNQNRILKNENQNCQRKIKAFLTQIHDLETQLAPFLHQPEQQQNEVETYKQLQQKYQIQSLTLQKLEAKYTYMKQEAEKAEEKQNQIRQMYDKMEEERNFYKKKYENITEQLQSNSIQNYASLSPTIKSTKSLAERSPYSSIYAVENIGEEGGYNIESIQKQKLDQYQKQLLSLKKNLKDVIEENNFLRSVNAGSSKNKKSSSKDQLKAELADMKKIVIKLTEAVTEKDYALESIKAVNRQISQKLFQAEKRLLSEEENKEKTEISRLKKTSY